MTDTTTRTTAFCANCGAAGTGGRFCTSCGTPTASTTESAPAQPAPASAPFAPAGFATAATAAPAAFAQAAAPTAYVPRAAAAAQVAEYVELPGRGAAKLATMGQRLVARILDVIVVGLGYAILAGIFAAVTAVVVGSNRADDGSGAAAGIAGFIGAMFLISLLADLYEVIMITLLGRTVGKLIMGIRVVRQSDGLKPNLGNAILRFVTPGLASLIPFVGAIGALLVFLSPAFDSSGRRQGWHDKLGGTLVIAER